MCMYACVCAYACALYKHSMQYATFFPVMEGINADFVDHNAGDDGLLYVTMIHRLYNGLPHGLPHAIMLT